MDYFHSDSISIVIKLQAGGTEKYLVATVSTLVVVPNNSLSNSHWWLFLWNTAFEPFT
jgi:hypothetical protein